MGRFSSRFLLSTGLYILILLSLSCSRPQSLDQFMEQNKTLYATGPLAGVGELLVRHFFQGWEDGFFLDVGCSHFRDNSATYYLEEHQGWRGIGVDPLENLREGWRVNRPQSKFFALAASDRSGEMLKFFPAGGVSTTELDDKNLQYWKELKKFETVEIQVPTITLNDLLDQESVKKVDFLSMDINGAEPIALAGFDIQRFAPALVAVEASSHRHDELRDYFDQHGYVRLEEYLQYDQVNWYYVPKER